MPENGGSSAWDFITLVTAWNLYGLPVLLLAAGVFNFVKKGRLRTTSPEAIGLDGRRVVRILAIIHLGLGLHGAMRLVQELLTMRVMGVTESFANLVVNAISVVVDPLLALGLWRARPMARLSAIAWYVFLSAFGVYRAQWLWRYHVPFEPRTWPNHLAGKVMPLFLLVVMFLPRVKRVFVGQKAGKISRDTLDANEATTELSGRWSVISLVALFFLIVVVSNLAVDTGDWIERSVADWNQTEAY